MACILLVEDDLKLSRSISSTLRDARHSADVANENEATLPMAREEPQPLVTLDVDLPDISGLEALRRLRRDGIKIPILILTARDGGIDRVMGLDTGTDDHLPKPVAAVERAARACPLMRPGATAAPVTAIGSLRMDESRATASVGDRVVDLRPREWALLSRLAARVGQVVSKDHLTAEMFGHDGPVGPNTIEVYVGRLRKKLKPNGPQIRTIWGLGYMLLA